MQRYAHMRRSNVERAFQIHFDDCCYVCQPGAEKRQIRNRKEKQAVFCLLSSREVRNDAVPWIKKDQAIFWVHVGVGELKKPIAEYPRIVFVITGWESVGLERRVVEM